MVNLFQDKTTTDPTTNRRPKNGRQFRCNLTQTDLTLPTLKPTQMGLKIFPPHIFKNNFGQPHVGTFAKPHKPTHIPSFAKEPIPHPYKIFIALNINDVKYSLKKSQK